jgi:predicted transposase/invertase (TIGR01784 family)
MQISSRKLISFDWAIKKILRSKANFGILEGFLSELLFTDIQILEVLESEANQETEDNKFNRVDIKVKDRDQKIYIIEVQFSRELDYLQRILYSSSKVIIEHLPKGAPYSEVSKVISVNILHFDFGKGDDYIYHGTTRFIGLHNQTELELSTEQKNLYAAQKIADLYPEYYLIELRNFNNIAKDPLDEWVYFLKNEEIEENFTAKGLQEAKETLDVLKMKPQERLAYERHQEELHYQASMYQSTYILGQLEGRAEGRMEGVLSTAKTMKKMGLPVQIIAEATKLSAAEIEAL